MTVEMRCTGDYRFQKRQVLRDTIDEPHFYCPLAPLWRACRIGTPTVYARMARLASLQLAWSEALQLAVQQATALSEPKGRPSQGVSSLLADSLTCYELAQVCKLTLPPSELLVAQEALDRRHDAFLEEFDNFESKVVCDKPSPFVHPKLYGRSNDKRTRPCSW